MNAMKQISRITRRTTQVTTHRQVNRPLLKLSKRNALWGGELHDGFSVSHGAPPISYAYLFTMSWMGRIIVLTWFSVQASIVEHVYYGFPPEDWHAKWPKFWHKRAKPTAFKGGVCDLFDLYCWKGVDPRTDLHH